MNTTQKLLAITAVLLALLVLVTAADVAQDSQPWQAPGVHAGDSTGYAVNNPTLQQELHARIMAPAVAQNTEGAR